MHECERERECERECEGGGSLLERCKALCLARESHEIDTLDPAADLAHDGDGMPTIMVD